MSTRTEMGLLASSILVCLIVQLVRSQEDPNSNKGTTDNIKAVFEGRCWDYDVTKYNDLLPRIDADCNVLWDKFSQAFSFRAPCAVKLSSYEEFMSLAKQSLPANKVMFWSGIFSLAHRYSENGARFITLEDTMIGYLANSLTWCGQESPPGINYSSCPDWSDCPTEASESFWAGASATFASQATGNVTLMVDGSDPNKPAYRRSSFFGKYELPNLAISKVQSVNVIVAHALDKPKIEVCGNGSLALLKKDVTARGLSFTCEDDPDAVLHLLCSDDPASRECQLATAHQAGSLPSNLLETAGFNQKPADMLSQTVVY
ncbi:unnamed protein product [Candidula unifasciata]|uniref:ADP-ribosyl cyclase/cyclic ADP-ribose hydrolase n=1 Tax=Candidula unifasciata TaxID=100452 RepID=A0A8S3ZQ77_9EUPU|nr:unnamed protein product [Candidula unifasciata]